MLLCQAVCDEGYVAHRAVRTLALELAGAGFASLRFDYRGQGDSVGRLTGEDIALGWLADVGLAAEALRGAGVGAVHLVGMRLGATLGATWWVGQRRAGERLVLWDPCPSGRAFLREQQALQIQEEGSQDGAVDARGYYLDTGVARSISGIALPQLSSAAHDVLALTRPGHPGAARVRRTLTGSGVEWQDAEDQDGLLGVPPPLKQVPHQTIGRIVEWLAQAGAPGPPTRSLRWQGRMSTELWEDDDAPVNEQLVRLGTAGLVGVLTTGTGARSALTVVMANTSDEHHIGPGRMWVELARRWAGSGVSCLRFDLSGVGDSPRHPGHPEDVVYSPRWLDDYAEVMEELAELTPGDLLLVGHCSGAYSALEATARATRPPRAVCAVNPILTSRSMSPGSVLYDRRRLATRPWPAWVVAMSRWHHRPADWLWRACMQVVPWRAPMAGLAAAAANGAEVLAVLVAEDARPMREVLYWRWWGERRLMRRHGLRMQVLDWPDHPMYQHRTRLEVLRALDEKVRELAGQG